MHKFDLESKKQTQANSQTTDVHTNSAFIVKEQTVKTDHAP